MDVWVKGKSCVGVWVKWMGRIAVWVKWLGYVDVGQKNTGCEVVRYVAVRRFVCNCVVCRCVRLCMSIDVWLGPVLLCDVLCQRARDCVMTVLDQSPLSLLTIDNLQTPNRRPNVARRDREEACAVAMAASVRA